jgi:hypothetical protein
VGHKEAKVVAEGYTNTYVAAEGYWETKNVFQNLHAVNDPILHGARRCAEMPSVRRRIEISILLC